MMQLRILDDDGLIIRDERRYFGTKEEFRKVVEHFAGSLTLMLSEWVHPIEHLAGRSRILRRGGGGPAHDEGTTDPAP